MSQTTFTGKGGLGLLLCLTGLLSFGTATAARAQDDAARAQDDAARAQDDGRPADNTSVVPDQTVAQGRAPGPDDPRYANPNGGDPRYNNDPRYNDNSNGNYAGRSDDPRYANPQVADDGGSPNAQDPP